MFWTSELVKGVGQCKSVSKPFVETLLTKISDVADLYPSGIRYLDPTPIVRLTPVSCRPRRGYLPPTRIMDAPELRLRSG